MKAISCSHFSVNDLELVHVFGVSVCTTECAIVVIGVQQFLAHIYLCFGYFKLSDILRVTARVTCMCVSTKYFGVRGHCGFF